MKSIRIAIFTLVVLASFSVCLAAERSSPLIIDHTCTGLSQIPDEWIERAKDLTLHYAHTSHGSQIISGINNLESIHSFYSVAVRKSNIEGLPPVEDLPALRIYDGNPSETYIQPNDYWYGDDGKNRTRAVVSTGNYDLSMWSWCGQVTDYTSEQIQLYLEEMDQFDAEFPDVQFIYMTGHLDGTGSTGGLHQKNEQIRNYCREHNKVLFDFADIERFDPDGVDYLDLGATDACGYSGGNWAEQWCGDNPNSELCDSCDCSHSRALNCNQKARAFWWMMARLAGWGECLNAPTNLTGPNEIPDGGVILDWDDNSEDPNEDQFIIQRQVNDGDWNNDYARVASGETAFRDEAVTADAIYRYRVVAYLSDDGEGNSCTSTSSNIVTVPSDPDSDGDGTPDSVDQCSADPNKTEPGECGCGEPETDTDDDNVPDCIDQCPEDPDKTTPGQCDCGVSETDSDGDSIPDCNDQCPEDPDKTTPGRCGCGELETDSDGDSLPDCIDDYPNDPDNGAGGGNQVPGQPEPGSPANNATDISLTPTLTAGAFQDPDDGDTHKSSQWQVSMSDDFTQFVVNAQSESQLTSYSIVNDLEADTTYFWRVRYTDNNDAVSAWSEIRSFTTIESAAPSDQAAAGDDDTGDDAEEDDETCFIGVAGFSFGMSAK